MQKSNPKENLVCAVNLYKFASVVSAGAPVVMKYDLFSCVLLLNMQGTLHVCYNERTTVCDQKILVLTGTEAFSFSSNGAFDSVFI